jgi:hypothetical protein
MRVRVCVRGREITPCILASIAPLGIDHLPHLAYLTCICSSQYNMHVSTAAQPGIGSSSSFRHNAENAAAQAFDPLNVDPDDSSLETLIPSYGCDEERGTPISKPRCGTCVPPVDTTVDKECPRQPHCSTFDEGMHITNQKAALVPLCLGTTLPWPVLGDRRVCSKRC